MIKSDSCKRIKEAKHSPEGFFQKAVMRVNVLAEWLTNESRLRLLISSGTIVRNSHHSKSPTYHKQGLNLHKVQTSMNVVVPW